MCESVREWHDELLAEGTTKGETKFAALVSAFSYQPLKGWD